MKLATVGLQSPGDVDLKLKLNNKGGGRMVCCWQKQKKILLPWKVKNDERPSPYNINKITG